MTLRFPLILCIKLDDLKRTTKYHIKVPTYIGSYFVPNISVYNAKKIDFLFVRTVIEI